MALALPEAWEDHPWGETVVKVGKKVFVFLGTPGADAPQMSVKLAESLDHARSLEGASPTRYDLGKAGWTTIEIHGDDFELLADWVQESYRNVAPKHLVARVDAEPPKS